MKFAPVFLHDLQGLLISQINGILINDVFTHTCGKMYTYHLCEQFFFHMIVKGIEKVFRREAYCMTCVQKNTFHEWKFSLPCMLAVIFIELETRKTHENASWRETICVACPLETIFTD